MDIPALILGAGITGLLVAIPARDHVTSLSYLIFASLICLAIGCIALMIGEARKLHEARSV